MLYNSLDTKLETIVCNLMIIRRQLIVLKLAIYKDRRSMFPQPKNLTLHLKFSGHSWTSKWLGEKKIWSCWQLLYFSLLFIPREKNGRRSFWMTIKAVNTVNASIHTVCTALTKLAPLFTVIVGSDEEGLLAPEEQILQTAVSYKGLISGGRTCAFLSREISGLVVKNGKLNCF